MEIEKVQVVNKPATYRNHTDPELVGLCLLGDGRAWEALIRRYRRFIFSVALKFGFTGQDASDVFQTVCVKLLEHLQDVKDDRKVSGWLATTTGRLCIATLNMRQRETGTEEETDEPEDPSGTLEDIKLKAEKHQLLRDTVDQLPDRCKALIEMLYLDKQEPSYDAVSEQLGMPVASIGPNRARCLDKLRLLLHRRGIKN